MFNKVLLTFSTRIMTAVLSVVNVLIGTNYLGVEGYGTISLIILGITIYLMIQNLLTGTSIVYYISRIKPSSIALLSYLWAGASIIGFVLLIYLVHYLGVQFDWSFELVPKEFIWHNVLLASGYGLMNIHLNMLLGRERIKSFNLIFLIQHGIATSLLLLFYVILGYSDIQYYLMALYLSYFIAYLTALAFTLPYFKEMQLPSFVDFKSMIKYGILGQSANVFQLLNYRLNYYLIDIFIGRASLGVFSAATQISEGLWILGKSIATVQFARISNSDDKEYAKELSLKLMKFTAFITMLPLVAFILLPRDFYVYFLGDAFGDVRSIILWLAPGTIALTASMMMSHYFSGIGKIIKNTIGSFSGMLATIIFGFLLIPIYGIKGAALVNSLSYVITYSYLLYQFNKNYKLTISNLLINSQDIRDSWNMIVQKFR